MTLTAQDMLAESQNELNVWTHATLKSHSGEPLHSWWGATSPANVMVWLLWEAGIDSRRIAGVYADMLRLVQSSYEVTTHGDNAVSWCIGELQSWADGDGAIFKLEAAGKAAAGRMRHLWPQSYWECSAMAAWCACSGVANNHGDGMIVEHLKGSHIDGVHNDRLTSIITDHVSAQELEAAWRSSHHGQRELRKLTPMTDSYKPNPFNKNTLVLKWRGKDRQFDRIKHTDVASTWQSGNVRLINWYTTLPPWECRLYLKDRPNKYATARSASGQHEEPQQALDELQRGLDLFVDAAELEGR